MIFTASCAVASHCVFSTHGHYVPTACRMQIRLSLSSWLSADSESASAHLAAFEGPALCAAEKDEERSLHACFRRAATTSEVMRCDTALLLAVHLHARAGRACQTGRHSALTLVQWLRASRCWAVLELLVVSCENVRVVISSPISTTPSYALQHTAGGRRGVYLHNTVSWLQHLAELA